MPTKTKTRLKIQIVEDHQLTLLGIRSLIEAQGDLVVCAESCTSAEALDHVIKTKPDLVITDITLPGRSGLELVQDLNARCPGIPTLVFSMHSEGTFARRALEIGARGYVMKSDTSEQLLKAIRSVASGEIYISPTMSTKILEFVSIRSKSGRSGIESLSPKEFEVFRLFGEGCSTIDIAKRLNMSPKTVDSHREHIKIKLQISTMTKLISIASCWCADQCNNPD